MGTLELQKNFMEYEAERMIMQCFKSSVPSYKHEKLEVGDNVIAKIGENKDWTGPYKVVKDGSMSVEVSVNGEVRDVSRNRVSKWYDWGDQFKEEAIEQPKEKMQEKDNP